MTFWTHQSLSCLVLLLLAAIAPVGCSTIPEVDTSASNLSLTTNPDRNKQLVETFEDRRAEIKLITAQQKWERNAYVECEAIVREVLQSTPHHLEAQLFLADLLVELARSLEAQPILEQALVDHPDSARVHHSLSMLYTTMETPDKAAFHFRQAAELEPENRLYTLLLTKHVKDNNLQPSKSLLLTESQATPTQ